MRRTKGEDITDQIKAHAKRENIGPTMFTDLTGQQEAILMPVEPDD